MVRERIEELRRQLEYHNHKYYVENDPSISDFEFDALMRELQQLEEAHPEFADPDSPTVRVGSDISSEFATVRHRYPMLSLGNTYSLDELHEFLERIEREAGPTEYVCELKFDGTAISLTYENGRLLRAVTRGDGVEGDDVTANIRTIRSVPLRLRGDGWPAYFEIRGEVLMPYASFDKINAERERPASRFSPIRAMRRPVRSSSSSRPWWRGAVSIARSTSSRATTCLFRPIGRACRRPANGVSRSRSTAASAVRWPRSTLSSPGGTRRGETCRFRPTAW